MHATSPAPVVPFRHRASEIRSNAGILVPGSVSCTVDIVSDSTLDERIAAQSGGPVVDTTSGHWGAATASFNTSRTHRYRLSRIWDPAAPRVNFVMLNPSTADAFTLDPTVRRCAGYAQQWGMGALEVTNIFALRSTDPRALYQEPDPVGTGNDTAILAAAGDAQIVIAAWGTHGQLNGRGEAVRALLADAGIELQHLRITKHGHPAHPLYLPGDLTPQRW